jgi:hypothetical protein
MKDERTEDRRFDFNTGVNPDTRNGRLVAKGADLFPGRRRFHSGQKKPRSERKNSHSRRG